MHTLHYRAADDEGQEELQPLGEWSATLLAALARLASGCRVLEVTYVSALSCRGGGGVQLLLCGAAAAEQRGLRVPGPQQLSCC